MNCRAYPTDLFDAQWVLMEPYVATNGYGQPLLHSKRELLNAIFYQAHKAKILAQPAKATNLAPSRWQAAAMHSRKSRG